MSPFITISQLQAVRACPHKVAFRHKRRINIHQMNSVAQLAQQKRQHIAFVTMNQAIAPRIRGKVVGLWIVLAVTSYSKELFMTSLIAQFIEVDSVLAFPYKFGHSGEFSHVFSVPFCLIRLHHTGEITCCQYGVYWKD